MKVRGSVVDLISTDQDALIQAPGGNEHLEHTYMKVSCK
jgi:hypothetical protein